MSSESSKSEKDLLLFCCPAPAGALPPNELPADEQPEEAAETGQEKEPVKAGGEQAEPLKSSGRSSDSTEKEKIAGVVIVVCISAGSVAFFAFRKKIK